MFVPAIGEPLGEWFTEDAQLAFEGVPVGPFDGREAIAAAYEARPPDDEVVIFGTEESGDEVVARYGWLSEPSKQAGRMLVTPRAGKIEKLTVTFDFLEPSRRAAVRSDVHHLGDPLPDDPRGGAGARTRHDGLLQGRDRCGAARAVGRATPGAAAAGRRWRPLLAYTAIEVALPWLLLGHAETKLTSSLTGLLLAAVPLVAALIVTLSGQRERLGRRRWLGLLVGIVGVGAIVGLDVGHIDLARALARSRWWRSATRSGR